jgi:hypothetical protein
VQNLARAYHLKKIPSLLLKLNISKAFDYVSWEYLLEFLLHRGFPSQWHNWIALLLSTSSSSIRLNGTGGHGSDTSEDFDKRIPCRCTSLFWQLTCCSMFSDGQQKQRCSRCSEKEQPDSGYLSMRMMQSSLSIQCGVMWTWSWQSCLILVQRRVSRLMSARAQ